MFPGTSTTRCSSLTSRWEQHPEQDHQDPCRLCGQSGGVPEGHPVTGEFYSGNPAEESEYVEEGD
jgi:hypothetical protein